MDVDLFQMKDAKKLSTKDYDFLVLVFPSRERYTITVSSIIERGRRNDIDYLCFYS